MIHHKLLPMLSHLNLATSRSNWITQDKVCGHFLEHWFVYGFSFDTLIHATRKKSLNTDDDT